MASTGEEQSQTSSNLGMYLAGLAVIAFLGPAAFIHSSYAGIPYPLIQIMAMSWLLSGGDREPTLMIALTQPYYLLAAQLMTFPRLVFAYMISRLYNEKTTMKRVVCIGIIAELWLPAIYYIPFLLQATMAPSTVGGVTIIIPIPILLVAGLYLLRKKPTKGLPVAWAEDDCSEDWWDKQTGTTSKME
ncbi:MAG: hypothetical protein ACFFEU_11810 [Candidatus Thorarchaeota archaeon]